MGAEPSPDQCCQPTMPASPRSRYLRCHFLSLPSCPAVCSSPASSPAGSHCPAPPPPSLISAQRKPPLTSMPNSVPVSKSRRLLPPGPSSFGSRSGRSSSESPARPSPAPPSSSPSLSRSVSSRSLHRGGHRSGGQGHGAKELTRDSSSVGSDAGGAGSGAPSAPRPPRTARPRTRRGSYLCAWDDCWARQAGQPACVCPAHWAAGLCWTLLLRPLLAPVLPPLLAPCLLDTSPLPVHLSSRIQAAW